MNRVRNVITEKKKYLDTVGRTRIKNVFFKFFYQITLDCTLYNNRLKNLVKKQILTLKNLLIIVSYKFFLTNTKGKKGIYYLLSSDGRFG